MRLLRSAFVLAAVVALLCALPAIASAVKTARPPQLVGTAPGVVVDPILSTSDVVPSGQTPPYQMSGIPDGLGVYGKKARRGHRRHSTFHVFMNHELGVTFPGQPPGVDTRISDLTVNRRTLDVQSAKYAFKGTEGFERFTPPRSR
jgi:hypothetical protein